MMKKAEQVDRHEPGVHYRRWLKRLAVRTLRREAKRDPEGAPRRFVWRGYST